MSSGFSLKFVSFLQNYPTCSCEGYACCSCRRVYALQLAEPFRHGDGTHAPLSEQLIPIAGITWFSVNADALVRLTRAVLPAISPTAAPNYPSRVRPPRQQSQLAVGAQCVMVAGLVYRKTNTVNIAEPQ